MSTTEKDRRIKLANKLLEADGLAVLCQEIEDKGPLIPFNLLYILDRKGLLKQAGGTIVVVDQESQALKNINDEVRMWSTVLGTGVWPKIREIQQLLPVLDTERASKENFKERILACEEVLDLIEETEPDQKVMTHRQERLRSKQEEQIVSRVMTLETQADLMAAFLLWFYKRGGRETLQEIAGNLVAIADYGVLGKLEKVVTKIDGLIDEIIAELEKNCQFSGAVERLKEQFGDLGWEISRDGVGPSKKEGITPKKVLGRLASVGLVLSALYGVVELTKNREGKPEIEVVLKDLSSDKPLPRRSLEDRENIRDVELPGLSASTAETRQETNVYIIQEGDWLSKIAMKYGVTVEELLNLNPQITDKDKLEVGQEIKVPAGSGSTDDQEKQTAAASAGPTVPSSAMTDKPVSQTKESSTSGNTYVVKPGDTLGVIAGNYPWTTVQAIAAKNRVSPNLIKVGQVLVIPEPGEVITIGGIPTKLEKYIGVNWSSWESVPQEVKTWWGGIIFNSANKYTVPPVTLYAVMAAEQMGGGFRLEDRISSASAAGPFQITPGWAAIHALTGEDYFKIKDSTEMMARRLSDLGLTVKLLEKIGEEKFYVEIERYLCKHLNGEGNSCNRGDWIRGGLTEPYVKNGVDQAKRLTNEGALTKTAKLLAESVYRRAFDQKFGYQPGNDEVKKRLNEVGNSAFKSMASGQLKVEEVGQKMIERSVNEKRAWVNPNAIPKVVIAVPVGKEPAPKTNQNLPAGGKDSKGANVGAAGPKTQSKDNLPSGGAKSAEQSKNQTRVVAGQVPEDVFVNKEEEAVQTAAVANLGHMLPRKELKMVMEYYKNDTERIVKEYVQASKEAEIYRLTKELWQKKNGEEPLNEEIKLIVVEAVKVWGEKDPKLVNELELAAAKNKVREILQVPSVGEKSGGESEQGQSSSGSQEQNIPSTETRVYDKETGKELPQVGSVYKSGDLVLRDTTRTADGELNPWEVHGNRDYYELGISSWFGQDYLTTSPDKTVVSPIDGIAEGGFDTKAGYYCSITGTGIDEGLHVRILHLAGPCQDCQVKKGQEIGRENSDSQRVSDHVHVICQWGNNGKFGGRDVPFSLLLSPEDKPKGVYVVKNYVEGSTPDQETFAWLEQK